MFVFVVEGAGREGAMERERNGMKKKKTESLHRRARGNNEAARVGRCQTRLKADTWGRDPLLSLRSSLPRLATTGWSFSQRSLTQPPPLRLNHKRGRFGLVRASGKSWLYAPYHCL